MAKVLYKSWPLQRALDEIHAAPERDWAIDELAAWSAGQIHA